MKFLSIFLLFGALLFASSHEHEHKDHHLPLDMRYLDLTPTQYEQVRTIIKTFKHEHKYFHRQKIVTRQAISQLFLAENFDTAAFIRLTTDLNERAIKIQATFLSKMQQVLTPYQRKNFVDYMEEWEVE